MASSIESNSPISSAGVVGLDTSRSNGRTYWTRDELIDDGRLLQAELIASAVMASASSHGEPNRRSVYRAHVSENALRTAVVEGNMPPLEVSVPLRVVDHRSSDWLIVHGHNLHYSPVPEWQDVYKFWKSPPVRTRTPLQRVQALPSDYSLTNHPVSADIECLLDTWKPFGWTREGIEEYVETFPQTSMKGNGWFSGVRDENGNIVTSCMADSARFGGIEYVEPTEFGTRREHRNKGLCTTNVAGLIAQIVSSKREEQHGLMTVIGSEFNMHPAERSDVVGYAVGMTIPGVEGAHGLEDNPLQVLRYNVAIADGTNGHTLRGSLPQGTIFGLSSHHQSMAPYWQNFIVGVLPERSLRNYYDEDSTGKILSRYN
jgi:hypothetical protein